MIAEREREIRRNHANCDTRDKPCDAEDLLAALDAERQTVAKLRDALKFYARNHEAFANTNGGADLLWPPIAFADNGDRARDALKETP